MTDSSSSSREDVPEASNRLGIDGIEFIEYTTSQPQALGQVLEGLGFRPVARHRSREVTLYRQGDMNLVVNAGAADALAHVAGYTVANDYAVRDHLENWYRPNLRVKNRDGGTALGPWFVPAAEVPDPHALNLRGLVNGELRQSSNTSLMIFKIWDQISVLSQAMTLEPGDVIYTGTCSGVGAGMTPPQFLKPGDHVRIEIDQLGAIEALCTADVV